MDSNQAQAPSLIPVILSGGAGSRLWPVSREGHPKPFIRLPDGQTLLQKTLLRARAIASGGRVLLVTNRDYYFISRDEVQRVQAGADRLSVDYLLEPCGRNTAAAIGAAARWVSEHVSPSAVLMVMPADHLIEPESMFVEDVRAATALAAQGAMLTFGVPPTHPETGYGYIEADPVGNAGGALEVRRFVEKPSQAVAQGYLDAGNYWWNSGMFCMRADVFLAELAEHRPALAQGLDLAWSRLNRSGDMGRVSELPADEFAQLESISVDYAVMERSRNLRVQPLRAAWNDIGSWRAMADLCNRDKQGNRVLGDAVLVDTADCFVHAEDRLVATVGLRDLMVVDTPDALLVARMDQDQQVKDVVAQLKKRGHESYRTHRTVIRPWGTYTVLEEGEGYKIKRLEVKPGGQLSLQMHHHRSEHWIVVSGTARVSVGDAERLVMTNESAYIPVGQRHRVENPGVVDLVLIEVQSGAYLGEDDIVRFSDVYGRA